MTDYPQEKPEGNKQSVDPAEPAPASAVDWENPAQYATLDLRSVMLVLAQEQRAHTLDSTLTSLSSLSKEDPLLVMRVPVEMLALFSLCKATTGTCSGTLAADVAAMVGRNVVAFSYTDTSTNGCGLGSLVSVTLTDTGTGTVTPYSSMDQLQHTPIGAAGATGQWFGKTKSSVPAIPVGSSILVTVTFSGAGSSTLFCHTCTPAPVALTFTATSK
jgi:hypothetical protein